MLNSSTSTKLDLNLSNNLKNALSQIDSGSYFVFHDIGLSKEESEMLANVNFIAFQGKVQFSFTTLLPLEKLNYNLVKFFEGNLQDGVYASNIANIVERIYISAINNNQVGQVSKLLVSLSSRDEAIRTFWHAEGCEIETTGDYLISATLIGPSTVFQNTSNDRVLEVIDILCNTVPVSTRYLDNTGESNYVIDYSKEVVPMSGELAVFNFSAIHSTPANYVGERLNVLIGTVTPIELNVEEDLAGYWPLEL